jgi:hypothetical protein
MFRVAFALFAVAAGVFALLSLVARSGALAPAGSDTFEVLATAHIQSRGGVEIIAFTGAVTIERDDAVIEDGVEVAFARITSLSLKGYSSLGHISAMQSTWFESTGELRSLQPGQQFPASLTFDAFVEASQPLSPVGPILVHNNTPLELAGAADIEAWPPYGLTLQLSPVYQFDNDGDGLIDEDSADDDGDGLVNEDRAGTDINSPGFECFPDPDCDGLIDEDPPPADCPMPSAGVATLCDNDSDGQIDEDPSCVPLFNPTNTHLKAGVCLRDLSVLIAAPGTITPVPTATEPTATPTRTPRPTATPTPRPAPGDASCDGRVNAIDAALVLQFAAALVNTLPCHASFADVNQTGSIDALDALLILQFVAGLLDSL